jgi:leucyl/phenylalanyl-tRNA--protein transferase
MHELMKFKKVKFPPLENADDDGLLAASQDINCDFLCSAYLQGIFPWPIEEEYILWFTPPERGILFFDKFKIPERTQRYLKKDVFTFKVNTDFGRVIENCANAKRKGQPGTWITEKLIEAYKQFHIAGQAWSFEAYNQNGILAGGLYGVWINNYFSGESMFSLESNASKFTLINAVSFLRKHGLKWMDIQVMTPLLSSFGAQNLPRTDFLDLLKGALQKN